MQEEGLFYDPKALKLIRKPPIEPILSLERLLEIGAGHVSPGDKVILAFNLARALLRLYSADMSTREMNARNIYFLFDPTSRMAFEGYNPYLACTLVTAGSHQDDQTEQEVASGDHPMIKARHTLGETIKLPTLVYFGELLMEIALQRKMGPYTTRMDIDLLAEIEPENYTGQVVKMVGKGYVDVIVQCLLANQTEDSESDYDSASDYDPIERGDFENGEISRSRMKEEAKDRLCKKILEEVVVAGLKSAKEAFIPDTDANSNFEFSVKEYDPRLHGNRVKTGAEGDPNQQINWLSVDEVELNVRPDDHRWVQKYSPLHSLILTNSFAALSGRRISSTIAQSSTRRGSTTYLY